MLCATNPVYIMLSKPLADGGSPSINSEIQVKYKGYLTDGTVFDETPGDDTRFFFLGQMIRGWQIGIPRYWRKEVQQPCSCPFQFRVWVSTVVVSFQAMLLLSLK